MSATYHHQYLFGPVPSRRLGLSLGVDVIPKKLCTLDCVYCEVGQTDMRALRRKEYITPGPIIAELQTALRELKDLDFITFSGSGEPTLNSMLGELIHAVKLMTRVPVAVITNGTLLYRDDVRRDLLEADVVLPSLDAATQPVFEQINRPHAQLNINTIINGLKQFRAEYLGKIWLEILFVDGINDTEDELAALRQAINEIKPDKVQLNTVIRPPVESFAHPINEERLREIQTYFGDTCEIVGTFQEKNLQNGTRVDVARVISLLERRAMTAEEIAHALGITAAATVEVLRILQDEGLVVPSVHSQRTYFHSSFVQVSLSS